MWRLSALARLLGLAAYTVGLAVAYTAWAVLILCGVVLAAAFRLLGVSVVRFERVVARHRGWWDAALRALPDTRAGRPERRHRDHRSGADDREPTGRRGTTWKGPVGRSTR
jgi:hypothetical protein